VVKQRFLSGGYSADFKKMCPDPAASAAIHFVKKTQVKTNVTIIFILFCTGMIYIVKKLY
jgi:hypothetical protein